MNLAARWLSLLGFLFLFSFSLRAQNETKKNEIVIEHWKILGPFMAGPQEGGLDHLLAYGGQEKITPDSAQTFYSILTKKGEVKWFDLEAKGAEVSVKYPQTQWEAAQTEWGRGALAAQGYAYTELSMPKDTCVLVYVEKVGEFFINGVPYFGEGTRFTYNFTPVLLKKGRNKILLKISEYGDPSFHFKLLTEFSSIFVPPDLTLPDLVRGQALKEMYLGIPLINTTGQVLKNLSFEFEGKKYISHKRLSPEIQILPFSILKLPLSVIAADIPPESKEKSEEVVIRVRSGDSLLGETRFQLNIREPYEDRKETFISSIDESVQYYSVLPPKNYNDSKTYDLIINLHGANVEAPLVTAAHSQKDWAFVVAPTNRRPYGFAYQEIGRLDVFEVIAQLMRRYRINRDSIYLAGHSMGGQGAWHIGLHSPSTFAGIAPSAGWSSFYLYTPFLTQIGDRLAPPELLRFRDRVLMDSNNPYFLQNAINLPVYITQSNQDDVVSPFHARLFQKHLKDLNYSVELKEVESKEHCQADPKEEGRGLYCVDHPELWKFLRAQKKNNFPLKVNARFYDLSIENQFYWVKVEEQDQVFSESFVEVRIEQDKMIIESKNIMALSLSPSKEIWSDSKGGILWNGKKIQAKRDAEGVIRLRRNMRPSGRQLKAYGSFKSVFQSPFIIVYGTQGKASEDLLHNARLLSNRVWKSANGFVKTFSDRDVSLTDLRSANLILFGSPIENKISKFVMDKMPIHLRDHKIEVGTSLIDLSQKDFGFVVTYPSPYHSDRLVAVVGGTSPESEKWIRFFRPMMDRLGTGLPDFAIFDQTVMRDGWAGIKVAGFFSRSWDLSNRDFYWGLPD